MHYASVEQRRHWLAGDTCVSMVTGLLSDVERFNFIYENLSAEHVREQSH